jgi:hypothetical protein
MKHAPRAVPEGEGEDPAEVVEKPLPLPVMQDDLAVRPGLKRVRLGERPLQVLVVVDLAVDRQRRPSIRPVQRLGAVLDVDDGQALVGQDGAVGRVDAAPVGPAVPLALRQRERGFAEPDRIGLELEDGENAAHRSSLLTPDS